VIALALAIPLTLVIGVGRLRAQARRNSGEPLARAIANLGFDRPRVPHQRRYNPRTHLPPRRPGLLVSNRGDQTTSVYQGRYQQSLIARGLWAALDERADRPPADVIVRPRHDSEPPPSGCERFFTDDRFTAWRRIASR